MAGAWRPYLDLAKDNIEPTAIRAAGGPDLPLDRRDELVGDRRAGSAALATDSASIGVTLAGLARAAPAAGHQLRRHPHDPLAPGQQEPLRPA